jgi:hypothetical protein
MAEVIFTILLFAAITFITAVLFGGWVVFTVFKVLWRGIEALFPAPTRPLRNLRSRVMSSRTCPNPRCLQTNPDDARFCKRCGRPIPQPQRVAVRRAAMW